MSLGESVWATEIKLNNGFLGQIFFGNEKIPGTLSVVSKIESCGNLLFSNSQTQNSE